MVDVWCLLTTVLVTLSSVAGSTTLRKVACYHHDDSDLSVYNFSLPDVHGEKTIKYSDYKGKGAAFQLYSGRKRVTIMTNGNVQEPGGNGTEILNILKYVRPGNGFEPNFPLTKKIDVNGENEDPLFTYLKAYCPSVTDLFRPDRLFYKPLRNSDIRWNFEKFLINKEGKPVLRYPTQIIPQMLAKDIEDLLKEDISDLP